MTPLNDNGIRAGIIITLNMLSSAVVGMEGDKNDRPRWINNVFRQTVRNIVKNADAIANLKKAISDLELHNVAPKLLEI